MDEFLEESRLKLDRLQREHKIKEKEKGQEVKEELLVLREKEGSEVTKNKRLQFMSQLEAMKKDNEVSFSHYFADLNPERYRTLEEFMLW